MRAEVLRNDSQLQNREEPPPPAILRGECVKSIHILLSKKYWMPREKDLPKIQQHLLD
jgi:hypothetical protein